MHTAFARPLMILITVMLLAASRTLAGPTTQPSPQEEAAIRKVQCAHHLSEIQTAVLLYANDHKGMFPADLGVLVVEQQVPLQTFICPAAPSALPADLASMKPADQAAWVNAHTDYIYLGAKRGLGSPDRALIYDRDDNHADGMLLAGVTGNPVFAKLDEVHQRVGPKAGTERPAQRLPRANGAPPAIPLITMQEAIALDLRRQLSDLKIAIMAFEVDTGRYPTQQEGLAALVTKPKDVDAGWRQTISRLPLDPWGHAFIYTIPGKNADFDISSAGPDGKPGTADDIRP